MHKTFFTLAARDAATHTSTEVAAAGYSGAKLYLTVSSVSSTGTVTPKVQSFNKTGSAWVDIPGAAFAALGAASTVTLTIHPSIAASANVAVAQCLGDTIRVLAPVATSTVTFSLGVDLIR